MYPSMDFNIFRYALKIIIKHFIFYTLTGKLTTQEYTRHNVYTYTKLYMVYTVIIKQ